jgi:subtilisin family serine protease
MLMLVSSPVLILSTVALALPTQHLEVDRLPRLQGKADVALWRVLTTTEPVFGGTRMPLYLRAADARAASALAALGVVAEPGEWVLAHLDAAGLRVAIDAAGVTLRSAPAHRLLLDVSRAEIGADRAQAGTGLDTARRGRGVLVGIIDTGIDLSHPAFRDPSGASRVVAVWDQDGFGCTRRMISRDLCNIADPIGHGTHVAGIAAGNDLIGGVAPEASIAVVRSDTFTRIADAVLYLLDLADARDQPLVINTSIGGHYGAHDGRTPLERYLGKVLGEGKLLVAAAGNDGDSRVHVGTTLGGYEERVAVEGLPFGQPVTTTLDLWAKGKVGVSLALELWERDRAVAVAELSASDSELAEGALAHGGAHLCDFSYGADFDDDHNLVHYTVLLDCSGGVAPPEGVRVALRLSGAGRIDGWINQSDYRYGTARFAKAPIAGWLSGDGQRAVVVPATAAVAIAVGAYTTRTEWRDEQSEVHHLADDTHGVLALFSSMGPTTAPTVTGYKPDLAAPGSVIVSARATTVPPGPNTLDGERLVMQGTSMAAPHVTGAVALMLQADPKLEPMHAREALAASARQDDRTGATPNPGWGYGKLDAVAAVATAEREARGCAATAAPLALVALVLLARRRR